MTMMNDRVLITNHDAAAANRVATSLSRVGFVVNLAYTSDEAIRLSTETRPALLIINPVMPALSGFEAASHIARRVDCKVLFLTTLAGDADFAEMLAAIGRDGIHCSALPATVRNADLVAFVRGELGPAVLLSNAGKDVPSEQATQAEQQSSGATDRTEPIHQAGPTDRAHDSDSEDDLDLSAGFVPTASDDTINFPGVPTPYEPYNSLLAIADYNLYQNNAFRVTGLQVTATGREIKRAYQEFHRNKELGRPWDPATILPHIVRPTDDEREVAFTQIGNPEPRLLQEFFWFWPDEDPDDFHQSNQSQGLDRLVEKWRLSSAQNDPYGIASHNLAVFYHLMALEKETSRQFSRHAVARDFWKNALYYWNAVVGNSRFWEGFVRRIQRVNDPRATPDLAQKIWTSLPEAILLINAGNAVRAAEAGDFEEATRQRQLMFTSGFGEHHADRALDRALTPLLEHLTVLCSQAKSQVETDPIQGVEVVRALNDAKSPLLKTLNCLLGADDRRRNAAHDEVASTIRSCLIDYVNKTEAWSVALPLFENCLALAEEPTLQAALSEDIVILNRNLDLQRRTQSRPTPASTATPQGRAEPASARQSTSGTHKQGSAIGQNWQRMPLFGKFMLAVLTFALIGVLCVISSGSNSGATPIAPPAVVSSSDLSPSPPPATDSSPNDSSPAPPSAGSAPTGSEDSELNALKTEIQESKAHLRRLDEQIQAINSEMSEYTPNIDSDRSTLDRMKSDNDAGIEVDQAQYEEIRRRHNQTVASFNMDAERHNSLLREYHRLLAETNEKVGKYNSRVKSP